jgi:hypothetical protein
MPKRIEEGGRCKVVFVHGIFIVWLVSVRRRRRLRRRRRRNRTVSIYLFKRDGCLS